MVESAAADAADADADNDDDDDDDFERNLSCLRMVVASSGAAEREAIARIGGLGRAFSERSRSGTEG